METRVLTLFDDDFFAPEPSKEKPKKEKAVKAEISPVPDDAAADIADKAVVDKTENQLSGITVSHEEKQPLSTLEPESLVDDKVPVNEAVGTDYTDTEMSVASVREDLMKEAATPEPEPTIFKEEDIPVTAFKSERLVDDKVLPDEIVTVPHAEVHVSEVIPESAMDEPELMLDENGADDDAEPAAAAVAADANKELNQQILSELIQLDYTALMQKNYSFDLNNATVINKELPARRSEPEAEEEIETSEPQEFFEEVTPLPEWNLDKKYYTIGEVAQLFGVNTSHIRFWTNEFKLKPRTTRKGDRLYSPKDIAELRLIHHLVKEKKHTIKGAREKLKVEKTDVNNKLDLKESLVRLKDTLLKIKEQL